MTDSRPLIRDLLAKANSHEDQFLRVELHAGLMFSRIALDTLYQEKRERNCVNARRAYDTLLYFMSKPSKGEFAASDAMTHGLAPLKLELELLGEVF